ncbi:MAG: hypothetical protein ACM3UL_04940 [Ignavibacteria bacterium]|jgi:hypothetical protein
MGKAQNSTSSIITRNQLGKLKLKAIRAGVWFKALPRIDRVLVDLTIQVADNIRSSFLAKSIFAVVNKLESLLESKFDRLTRIIGAALAEKASVIAQAWGNYSAKSWATDTCFARYLAVMQANK